MGRGRLDAVHQHFRKYFSVLNQTYESLYIQTICTDWFHKYDIDDNRYNRYRTKITYLNLWISECIYSLTKQKTVALFESFEGSSKIFILSI